MYVHGVGDDARTPKGVRMPGKFPLGQTVITPNARDTINPDDVRSGLLRHASGDWGDVDEHDRQENEVSLTKRLRLVSVYHDRNKVKFWIITEADRSATTILLPEDY
jgi:hypothetical protein